MKKRYFYIPLIICLLGFFRTDARAQNTILCGTDSKEMKEWTKRNPQSIKNKQLLEEYIKNYKSTEQRTTASKIIIPIVFHVIYDTKGVGNITKQQIYNALETINVDFNKKNADTSKTASYFKDIAANVGIEFRMAKLDPQGNCTDGITRTESDLSNNADENVKHLSGAESWQDSRYLNVWIVNRISIGAGGYAYYPGTAPAGGDGVLILNKQFGYGGVSNGDDGSIGSLTHEIGHYLSLAHTWGNSNTPGDPNNCSDDDGVDDTPNTIGSRNCDLPFPACPGSEKAYANVQNYMDYSFCYTMFTMGQKARMLAALNANISSRNNLWTEQNLMATGTSDSYTAGPCKPQAGFSSVFRRMCVGTTVIFSDRTQNAGSNVSLKWSFPGGTPASSTESSPQVVYNTPGVYAVSLIASNATASDTAKQDGFIIAGNVSGKNKAPFADDFEKGVFTSNDWDNINLTNAPQWEQYSTVSYSGKNALGLNSFANKSIGAISSLISPSLDFSGSEQAYMTFKIASAAITNDSKDVLNIYSSTNCGRTWVRKATYYTKDISTVGPTTNQYVPTKQDWTSKTVALTNLSNEANVLIKFELVNGGGNNTYLDDINIVSGLAAIDQVVQEKLNCTVFPNPTSGQSKLGYHLESQSKVNILVEDILGRELYHLKQSAVMAAGDYEEILPLIDNKGLYIIKIQINGFEIAKKLVVK